VGRQEIQGNIVLLAVGSQNWAQSVDLEALVGVSFLQNGLGQVSFQVKLQDHSQSRLVLIFWEWLEFPAANVGFTTDSFFGLRL
jgi:hypothetical protein